MSWTTIYVAGKPEFEPQVTHHLERSGFPFLPGYMVGENGLAMYWINEKAKIRDFKKAIGARTIFEYRLRFFPSLEAYHEYEGQKVLPRFTPREEAMIREMNEWQKENGRSLKHSA